MQKSQVFEQEFMSTLPGTKELLENRSGSKYRGGRFLISRIGDIIALIEKVQKRGLRLRLALDIPQLFSAHDRAATSDAKMAKLLRKLTDAAGYVQGLHLWGKRRNTRGAEHSPRRGLKFDYDERLKQAFLSEIYAVFDDGVERYLVLEVNSGKEDMLSILDDLLEAGFTFV